jgi:pimeloyl-ACP methyl ester carboxylesterase
MSNFRRNLAAFEDFDNLVFDLPRYGASDRPAIDEPLIPYAGGRVLRALDELGAERVSLVGNSFGGAVSAWIAATAPDRVDRAVLMAPGGMTPPGMRFPDDFPPGLQLLFGYMVDGPDRERMRAFVEAMLADPELVTDELVDQRFRASDREAEIDLSKGPPDFGDLRPLLDRITAPTQLIWGREDRFVPIDWSLEWVRAVADAELHILPHCGHWAQYERRERFDDLAGEFLRRS